VIVSPTADLKRFNVGKQLGEVPRITVVLGGAKGCVKMQFGKTGNITQ
jgi:hypothetical protein